ncbi:MAG: hypothetical protein AB7L90_00635 [Hyphomicrobiaceae bacterium]
MLPRIVLLLLQIAAAWFLADPIKAALPAVVGRGYDIFVYALLYAVIVTVVGFAGALVLKGLRVPTAGTFIASLVLAAILSAITLVSQINGPIQDALPLLRGNAKLYPLVGAILGYIIKR